MAPVDNSLAWSASGFDFRHKCVYDTRTYGVPRFVLRGTLAAHELVRVHMYRITAGGRFGRTVKSRSKIVTFHSTPTHTHSECTRPRRGKPMLPPSHTQPPRPFADALVTRIVDRGHCFVSSNVGRRVHRCARNVRCTLFLYPHTRQVWRTVTTDRYETFETL